GEVNVGAEIESLLASSELDEIVVADSGLEERRLLDLVEVAHRRGVKVRVAPRTTELLVERGEYVPGQGLPLFELRPPILVGAEQEQAALERANEASGALFKIRDDPRVTPVGRMLRRLSLDEVPNVINVLRGEMSLVGPRPLPVRDYERLQSWHRRRYNVLPGMTGLWQVAGRSDLTFDDLVRLDFYYIENWSIWLDISILLKTPAAVVARKGAY